MEKAGLRRCIIFHFLNGCSTFFSLAHGVLSSDEARRLAFSILIRLFFFVGSEGYGVGFLVG